MVFCQGCGAQNGEGARFCNVCGAPIARAGEPGGPLGGASTGEASAVTNGGGATNTTGRISLDAIGVRSPRRTYGMLAGGAAVLFAAGALTTWLAMGSSHEAPVPVDEPTASGSTTIPSGADAPDAIDFLVGTPEAVGTRRHPAQPGTTAPEGAPTSPTPSPTDGTASGGAASGGAATVPRGGASSGSGSASAGASTGTSTGSGTTAPPPAGQGIAVGEPNPSAPTPAPSTPTPSANGTAPRADRFVEGEAAPEDPYQAAMENYGRHVRSTIREFYAGRARACFDHASRNGEAARGTVLVEFTIQESGDVDEVSVVRNTTGDEVLGGCLQRQVDAWRLPPPPIGEGPVTLQMPFSG